MLDDHGERDRDILQLYLEETLINDPVICDQGTGQHGFYSEGGRNGIGYWGGKRRGESLCGGEVERRGERKERRERREREERQREE